MIIKSDEYLNIGIKRDSKLCRYIKMAVTGILMGMSACVWWFVLYPELCFPEDTYELVCDKTAAEDCMEEELYDMLTISGEGRIVIKSRMLEWLKNK